MALVLQICSSALRCDSTDGTGSSCGSVHVGVFCGMQGITLPSTQQSPRDSVSQARQRLSVYAGTSTALSVASGRVSYTLGLTGPCLSVDTACSSSLVAAHLGFAALHGRECHAALTVGIGLLNEAITEAFATAGMLSHLGRCHTFDQLADGYCRAEGCGAFVYRSYEPFLHQSDKVALADSAVQ